MHEIKSSGKSNKIILSKKIAIMGLAIFVLLTTTAILSYQNYNFHSQYLSELGIGSTAILFNLGAVLSGLLLIPLFVFHYKQNRFLSQLICYLGIASMICFIGIGVFPLTNLSEHIFTSGLFFVIISMTILVALIEFIKNNYNKNKISYTAKFLFHFISMFVIAVIIAYLLIQAPDWQKLAALSICIWIIDWIAIK